MAKWQTGKKELDQEQLKKNLEKHFGGPAGNAWPYDPDTVDERPALRRDVPRTFRYGMECTGSALSRSPLTFTAVLLPAGFKAHRRN